MVVKWNNLIAEEELETVSFCELEKDVGVLVHINCTYPAVFRYLKGFYNTMNSWQLDRDRDGWKFSKTAWIVMLAGDIAFDNEADVELLFENCKRNFLKTNSKENPMEVRVVPRFVLDLLALRSLFDGDSQFADLAMLREAALEVLGTPIIESRIVLEPGEKMWIQNPPTEGSS